MTRESRLRPAGLLFYSIIALNLLLSDAARHYILSLMPAGSESGLFQSVIAVLSVGFLIFTSDAIGYVFSSIDVFFWNLSNGRLRKNYSSGYWPSWDKFGYDLQTVVLEQLENAQVEGIEAIQLQNVKTTWKSLNPDVVLNYFWRQAPNSFIEFANRRNNAFYANGSIRVGMVVSLVLSLYTIWSLNLGFNWVWHSFVLMVSLVFLWIVSKNARNARDEELQFISLWLASNINPQLKAVLNSVLPNK